jgi:hypothetical protein
MTHLVPACWGQDTHHVQPNEILHHGFFARPGSPGLCGVFEDDKISINGENNNRTNMGKDLLFRH